MKIACRVFFSFFRLHIVLYKCFLHISDARLYHISCIYCLFVSLVFSVSSRSSDLILKMSTGRKTKKTSSTTPRKRRRVSTTPVYEQQTPTLPPLFTLDLNKRMARYVNEERKLGLTDKELGVAVELICKNRKCNKKCGKTHGYVEHCDQELVNTLAYDFRRESLLRMVRTYNVPEKLRRAWPALLERGVDSVLPPRKTADARQKKKMDAAPGASDEDDEDDEEDDTSDDEEDDNDEGKNAADADDDEEDEPIVLYYGSIIITLQGPKTPAKVSYATNADSDDEDEEDDEEDDNNRVNMKTLSTDKMRKYAVRELRGWPPIVLDRVGKWCAKHVPTLKLAGDNADASLLTAEQVKRFFEFVMLTRDHYMKVLKTQTLMQEYQAEHDASTVDESIYDFLHTFGGGRAAVSERRSIFKGYSAQPGLKYENDSDAASSNKDSPPRPMFMAGLTNVYRPPPRVASSSSNKNDDDKNSNRK